MVILNPMVQVIEDGGVPVYIGLLRPDPMKPAGCTFGDARCMVDRSQNCDKSGVMYSIQCNTCEVLVEDDRETSSYIGMTRTTLHNRMLGHLKDQHYKKSISPLHRHDTLSWRNPKTLHYEI